MYEDFYGELMIYWLLPKIMEKTYGGIDEGAEPMFEERALLKEKDETVEAMQAVNVFEYYGLGGDLRESAEYNVFENISKDIMQTITQNIIRNTAAVYGADAAYYKADAAYYRADAETAAVSDIYREICAGERTAENTLTERLEKESVFERVFGMPEREHFESEKAVFKENNVGNNIYKSESVGTFEREIAKTMSNAFKTEEKRENRSEIVINIGGITQNISGGGTEAADIGEAVARCLTEALNTTAEGAF